MPLFNALRQALAFLSMDELPLDERPPRSIWLVPKKMKKWWKAVEVRRKQKLGLKSDGRMEDEPIEGPVSKNPDTLSLLGLRE